MNRPVIAALLAVLLTAACKIHVTIWLAGYPVARPPVAGFLLAAIVAANLTLAWLICRNLRRRVVPSWRWSS